jgi:hypothetical protein
VLDPASSIAHEWLWHIDLAIAAVDSIIRDLEAKRFASEVECKNVCASYDTWVMYEFSGYLSYTQYAETKKQKPQPPF